MRSLKIVSAAHDDIEPGPTRDCRKSARISPNRAISWIQYGPTAEIGELLDFSRREVDVVLLKVVQVYERIHAQLAKNRERDRSIAQNHTGGRLRPVVPRGEAH